MSFCTLFEKVFRRGFQERLAVTEFRDLIIELWKISHRGYGRRQAPLRYAQMTMHSNSDALQLILRQAHVPHQGSFTLNDVQNAGYAKEDIETFLLGKGNASRMLSDLLADVWAAAQVFDNDPVELQIETLSVGYIRDVYREEIRRGQVLLGRDEKGALLQLNGEKVNRNYYNGPDMNRTIQKLQIIRQSPSPELPSSELITTDTIQVTTSHKPKSHTKPGGPSRDNDLSLCPNPFPKVHATKSNPSVEATSSPVEPSVSWFSNSMIDGDPVDPAPRHPNTQDDTPSSQGRQPDQAPDPIQSATQDGANNYKHSGPGSTGDAILEDDEIQDLKDAKLVQELIEKTLYERRKKLMKRRVLKEKIKLRRELDRLKKRNVEEMKILDRLELECADDTSDERRDAWENIDEILDATQ